MKTDYYQLLGLPPNATVAQIEASFLQLKDECIQKSLAYEEPRPTQGRLKLLQEAYDTLVSPEKRAQFDEERAIHRAQLFLPDDRKIGNEYLPLQQDYTTLDDSQIPYDDAPEEDESIAICVKCGCSSTLPEHFVSVWNNKYCPPCIVKENVSSTRVLYISLAVLALITLLYAWSVHGRITIGSLLPLIIALIVTVLLILHELSHAVAATVLGGKVHGIQIGLGQPLFHGQIYNTFFILYTLPVSGLCFASFPTAKWIRFRHLMVQLAGLLFHALVHLTLFYLGSIDVISLRNPIVFSTLIINGLFFVTNLWPRKIVTAVGAMNNDGAGAWATLTGKFKAHEIIHAHHLLSAFFALLREDNDQADEHIRSGLSHTPNDPTLVNLHIYQLLYSGDVEAALSAWGDMIENDDALSENGLMRAIVYNNYAYALIAREPSEEQLAIGKTYIDEAFSMVPWIATIKSTMAAYLLEYGQEDEAISLSLEAASDCERELEPNISRARATNLAIAALGYLKQGNTEKASDFFAEAQQLGPDVYMVKKAEARISTG